jgi:hypothetical protein
LPDTANVFSILKCQQRHPTDRSTLDSALGGDTNTATLEWLVSALEHARARGQTTLVGYLEEVADDVVFEVEAAAHRLGYT